MAWAIIVKSASTTARISSLPTTRTGAHYRHLAIRNSPLWGIRGGSDQGEQDNDNNETNEEEHESVVVMTTEEEETTSEDVVPLDTDNKIVDEAVEDVPVLVSEEEKEVAEESESVEESESETTSLSEIVDDEEEEEEELRQMNEQAMALAQLDAQQLRQKGKDLHDEGDWLQAAAQFYEASLLLQSFVHDEEVLQEYATCRLHEALCRLKVHDYQASVEACTAVLEREPPAAIRARALHRRSRAKLGLGLEEEALLDARQAAFLGDRKAVALYGKLMRQDSAGSENSSLQDLLQGGGSNPFLSSGDASSSPSSSSALLESLLNKSGDSGGTSPFGAAAAGPMGMLMNKGNKKGGLAKSVLSSLSKTVENESTQENICRYLQNASVGQVQQMAGMAGVPLSPSHASRLVDFCHSVTPRGIQKSVKTTKRLWYGVSLLRKMAQILTKYRFVLILWALSVWIKSAVRRPIPINKRAARLAMKQALKQGAV